MPVYTEASRAATGMLLVFAIRDMRSIRGAPVYGSISLGNVDRTSVILFPLRATDVEDDLRVTLFRKQMFGHSIVQECGQIATEESVCSRTSQIVNKDGTRMIGGIHDT